MIIVLVGPTASGKSSLGLFLAKKYHGIIVNGDAFQVYKEMEIGTAKPNKKQREEVEHYLYDILNPDENFSIFDYQKKLRETLEEHKDKMVFLIGGSGLYLKAGLYDYTLEEQSFCDMKKYDTYDNSRLYEELKKIDEEASKKIHPNNRRRVLRALEIVLSTGKKKSEIESAQEHKLLYDALFLGIEMEKEALYEKIDQRVEQMFSEGLVEETKTLIKKYSVSCKAFQAIGYKQIILGKNQGWSEEKIKEEIKKATKQYSKRQMTYFRNQLDVHWVHSFQEAETYIEQYKGEKNEIGKN